MNRLLGSTVYEAGPIDLCPDSGRQWRVDAAAQLEELGVFVLNPLDKPIDVGLEGDDDRSTRGLLKAGGHYDHFAAVMKTIRGVDLRMVDRSDFLLAKIDMEVPMCGTYEEIFWANRLKRPVVVWCPQGKAAIPDWMFAVLRHEMMFGSLDEAMAYLRHVDRDPVIDTLGRWMFFDPKRLYKRDVVDRVHAS